MRALVACALMFPVFQVSHAQKRSLKPPAMRTVAAMTEASRRAALPGELRITHVSLYKNGVGFFEHAGVVHGNAEVSLPLSSAQLNDVLASLTAVDLGGGHLSGANYNSTTPLDQQLSNLPLSLGPAPTQAELFAALRGARVEASGEGSTFTGRVLSTEVQPMAQAPAENNRLAPMRLLLTLVADSGATRTVELGPKVTVRVLENGLRADLNTYLQLLDRNRAEGTRRLVLQDRGVGERELRVSYLSEVPVWKSTYRVLLTTGKVTGKDESHTATVQGFSVIDNTTGEDWNGVQLSLIAGSPQSFLQPISQPIYDRRPEVPVAENAQAMPQTHESGENEATGAPPKGSASADLSSGTEGNPSSLFGSPAGTGGPAMTPSVIPKNINMMKDTGPPPIIAHAAPVAMPELYEQRAQEALEAHASTATWDDFFAYNLTDPVTIPRNGSALVPILQERLPVESVTLASVANGQPRRALWLTNTSALTLDAGSFAVVENGAFAGQGLTDPVHAGERRLLSYAVDQALRVSTENGTEVHRITGVRVARGVLVATTTEVATESYKLHDAAPESRTVLLEVPRRAGWTLQSAAKPDETTPGLYRFRVPVAAHSTAALTVSQERLMDQQFALVSTTEEYLRAYVLENGGSTALLQQLEPVFAAQRRVAELEGRVREVEGRISMLDADQKRLRENLAVLKGSPEERALVRRYTGELQAQEDALASLRHQLQDLQQQRMVAREALTERIGVASVEPPLRPSTQQARP